MTTKQMSESAPSPGVTNKASLRRLLRLQRRSLSLEHRQASALTVEQRLFPLLENRRWIASYSSINEELDTTRLNQRLATEGRLVMPRIDGEELRLYHVTHTQEQLVAGPWGLSEPDPSYCDEISVDEIEAILVPGIAFDERGHRLGYGKGYYDRLLSRLPDGCHTIGIAYKEQLVSYNLPVELHDQTLDRVVTD